MASWKTRNFVPDSDGEEEDGSIGTQSYEGLPNGHGSIGEGSTSEQPKSLKKESSGPKFQSPATTTHGLLTDQSETAEASSGRADAAKLTGHADDDQSEDELALPAPPRSPHLRQYEKQSSAGPATDDEKPERSIDGGPSEQASILHPLSSELQQPIHDVDNNFRSDSGTLPLSSAPSSPLTDLSSTPPFGPGQILSEDLAEGLGQERDQISPLDDVPQDVEYLSEEVGTSLNESRFETTYRDRRTFRARNPIQINPYQIEDGRYRQSWKARGLKPLRMDLVEDDVASQASGNASGEASAGGNEVEALGYSSDLDATVTQTSQTAHHVTSMRIEDDALPDLDSLLCAPRNHIAKRGNKRRKIVHVRSGKAENYAQDASPKEAGSEQYHNSRGEMRMSQGSRAPEWLPSPPTSSPSGHILEQERFPAPAVFRYPIGTTPRQLQTPVVSSEPRISRPIVLSDNESLSPSIDEEDVLLPRETPEELHTEESEQIAELVKARKKIKGVLPASWLRVDQKNKTGQIPRVATKRTISTTPEKQKGVARPLLKYSKTSDRSFKEGPVAFLLSDDSGPDIDTSRAVEQGVVQQSPNLLLNDTMEISLRNDDSESMEDDEIDQMLPSSTRMRRSRKASSTRKLQTTGGKYLNQSFANRLASKRQTRISDHVEKAVRTSQRPPKRRVQRLSIVDVHDNTTSRLQPNFLSIASRTAKSRTDKGRHSPSNKCFQLASLEDTAEVQDTLSKWIDNAIICPTDGDSVNNPVMEERRPLSQVSGNEVSGPLHRLREIDPVMNRRKYTVRKRQKTIEQILEQTKAVKVKAPITKEKQRVKAAKASSVGKSISSNLRAQHFSVPALLETGPLNSGNEKRKKVSRHPQTQIRRLSSTSPLNPLLARYLDSDPVLNQDHHGDKSALDDEPSPKVKSSRRRKRSPKYFPIEPPNLLTNDVFEGNEDGHDNGSAYSTQITRKASNCLSLHGLLPFGSDYSWTFDIEPLPTGQCFSSQTLLGSGKLKKALEFAMLRDLSTPTNPGQPLETGGARSWDAWTESVSTDLTNLTNELLRSLQMIDQMPSNEFSKCVSVLDSVLDYITHKLYFLDPIDRSLFLSRGLGLLETLVNALRNISMGSNIHHFLSADVGYFVLQLSMRVSVLSDQLVRISDHGSIEGEIKARAQNMFEASLLQTVQKAFADGTSDLLKFQQSLRNFSNQEIVDTKSVCKAEAFVVGLHLIRRNLSSKLSIWSVLQSTTSYYSTGGGYSVHAIERNWFSLFVIMPFFDIDVLGDVTPASRHSLTADNWSHVENLIRPVLNAYTESQGARGSTLNSYCRSLIARSLTLIRTWGWVKCESILRILYDFFAKNNLENLMHEESYGSPRFLENLSDGMDLVLEKNDRSFHLFLKMVSSALTLMCKFYKDKKIQGVAYRVTPNHSRSLPKDEAVRQEDLEALRNHHNLLSVLYFSSPSGFRPRLSIIRDLICVEESHIQACHINIRSWDNLVRYQLSTEEPLSALQPFVDWYNHFLRQVLSQHTMARTEVESHGQSVSEGVRETTISSNQRQIEAILCGALKSLHKALNVARTTEATWTLFTDDLKDVLELFDARRPRINEVIIQALDVISEFIGQAMKWLPEDDSQGFGDWAAFEELDPEITPESQRSFSRAIYQSLHVLLSDCFGASPVPEEGLLTKVVQTWIEVARFETARGSKSWNDYINPHGRDSWFALPRTTQTLMFTPLFLSLLVERDGSVYEEQKSFFLKSLITSAVARESQLKFQHRLTTVVLNQDRSNPLLQNLPFSTNESSGLFEISLDEFRTQRLALLSSVLSNLRESLNFATYHNLTEKEEMRLSYIDLLKDMMRAMRENYNSLGGGPAVHSSYTKFVQDIVGFLQQYTSEICPIDRFFLDARNFPLPADDPTYVVGRMKHYGLDLRELKTGKKLATFVQSVSERAVIDEQQDYMVRQFKTAAAEGFEHGDHTNMTLRAVLIQAIFPAYCAVALSTPCGWTIALPLCETVGATMSSIKKHTNGIKKESVKGVLLIIECLFISLQRSTRFLLEHPERLLLPQVLGILTKYYQIIRVCISTLDYCVILIPEVERSRYWSTMIKYFKTLATFALVHVLDEPKEDLIMPDDSEWNYPKDNLGMLRKWTLEELRSTLTKNWIQTNGEYEVRNGAGRKRVRVKVGTFEVEKERFMEEIYCFCDTLDAYQPLCDP